MFTFGDIVEGITAILSVYVEVFLKAIGMVFGILGLHLIGVVLFFPIFGALIWCTYYIFIGIGNVLYFIGHLF